MGTEDWLRFNWVPGGTCTQVTITFTTTDDLRYEIWTDVTTQIFSGTASQTLTSPTSFLIRVVGNPVLGGSGTGRWTVRVSEL